jgi:hypothetical protein
MPYARRGNSDERNYANKRGELAVIMSGEPAGILSVYQGGFFRFDYDNAYGALRSRHACHVAPDPFWTSASDPGARGCFLTVIACGAPWGSVRG